MEYVTKKYFKEIEISEIDFVNDNLLFGQSEDYIDKEYITTEVEHSWYAGESYPMEIDAMIETLNNLKEQGANFVEVVYHCDHIGYVFNGLEMRKATKQEIAEYLGEEQAQEKLEKEQEIAALEEKLRKLKEE